MWRSAFDHFLKGLMTRDRLIVRFADGSTAHSGPDTGHTATLHNKDDAILRGLCLNPVLALGEGYMDERIGFPDLGLLDTLKLLQGNRSMQADKMSLFTKNGELVRVEATGSPVKLSEGEDLEAHAGNLVYDIKARTLVLTGDAFIRHKGNTFEGAKVEYSLDSKRVDASSEGDQRVRLVIPAENQIPGNDKKDNTDSESSKP